MDYVYSSLMLLLDFDSFSDGNNGVTNGVIVFSNE